MPIDWPSEVIGAGLEQNDNAAGTRVEKRQVPHSDMVLVHIK